MPRDRDCELRFERHGRRWYCFDRAMPFVFGSGTTRREARSEWGRLWNRGTDRQRYGAACEVRRIQKKMRRERFDGGLLEYMFGHLFEHGGDTHG